MSKSFEVDDSDGYLEVAVRGPDGAVAARRLDLFNANNQYARVCDAHPDPIGRAEAWCEWLVSQGLPPVAQRTGFAIAEAVMARVADLGKGPGTTSGSVGSSGSTGGVPETTGSPTAPPAS